MARNVSSFKPYLVAASSGVAVAYAMPPYHWIILLFAAFSLFFLELTRCKRSRQAFWLGWWFGFGQFVAGLYWISYSLLVDPERFAWMVPFAVSLIPALLAIFAGFAAWLYWQLKTSRLSFNIWLFAVCWVIGEWLRGHTLSGFPWNLTGYAWVFSDAMLQITSVIGIYGLSLVTVVIAATPALVFQRPRPVKALAVSVLLLAGIYGFGIMRLASAEVSYHEHIKLRIVQANVKQTLKWDPQYMLAGFLKHLFMTKYEDVPQDTEAVLNWAPKQGDPAYDSITHVIWPETAVPYFLNTEPEFRKMMAEAVPANGFIITGSMRGEEQDAPGPRVWNAVDVIDGKGEIAASYLKSHLVPFGEYIPLRPSLPFVDKILIGSTDFSEGPGIQTITLKAFPSFSALICYEVIFPGKVVSEDVRPEWLLNVTNDAWFGNSAGPYQHLAIAKVRAIEEGLPLVRAANTGISAVFDPYGQVLTATPLNQQAVMDTRLPKPISKPTFYRIFEDSIVFLSVFFVIPLIKIYQ